MRRQIEAAGGKRKAELVLKNGKIVNVFTETVEEGDLAIQDGRIVGIGSYKGETETDLCGQYVCPGFIDGHIHLESSMVSPEEFARAVLSHGTTAVVTDPHEIANVAGTAGIRYLLETTEKLPLEVFVMLPSCVPSTDLDEAGAVLSASDLEPFFKEERILGLAEMMNSFGVCQGQEEVLEKLVLAERCGKLTDGHAPFLTGKELNAYKTAGIQSDHECSNLEEALEKYAKGQWIMVREGTAAKNLEALVGMLKPPYHQRTLLVTDDKHGGPLYFEGHLDAAIRKASGLGADPILAIKAATLNPALYFGLKDRGAIAPGCQADLVVFNNLKELRVSAVYKHGVLAAEQGKALFSSGLKEEKDYDPEIQRRVFHSFHMSPVTEKQLQIEKKGRRQRVIDLRPHELLTKERIVSWKELPGLAPGVDPEEDIVKLAAFERHLGTGHMGLGFLGRYGLKKGAVATSVGHDSHNLVVAGLKDEDMAAAANQVLQMEGGLALALDGKVVASLPLSIGGLMSKEPLETVDEKLEEMKRILTEWGIPEGIDGFMTLAFVSLPVIPAVRLNTYGMIDVGQQKVLDVTFFDC